MIAECDHVFAKIEWCNPTGSVKARPVVWMIDEGEKTGKLVRNKTTVIEPTSGNTGIALSFFANILRYNIELAVPERMSNETKEILKMNGAKLLETEDDLCPRVGPGTDQAIALAAALIKNHPEQYYSPNQYENDANFRSHYNGTGPEIWKQTNGNISAFISGIGTGGTITGVGTYLKEKNQEIEEKIVNQILNSKFKNKCMTLNKLKISETLPIIKNCNISVCNDTSFSHLSAALGIQTIVLMTDTPMLYGNYSPKMHPILPDGEKIVTHNTLGKDKINPEIIYNKMKNILNLN